MKKLLLILALLFASAGAKDDKTITIGATPVPFGEILEFAKPLFAKKGYELKIVEFNDFAIPNVALNDGELDANFFQHKPYLQAFNDNKGTKLVAINSVAIIPMAIYSKSLKSLDELKNGASVSVPNDPSNEDRAFELLLQFADTGFVPVALFLDSAENALEVSLRQKSCETVRIHAIQILRQRFDFSLNKCKL